MMPLAFYACADATILNGNIVPVKYVHGVGHFGNDVTDGVIRLERGKYLIYYSVNGKCNSENRTITATPEYSGSAHSAFARSATIDDSNSYFLTNNSFVADMASDTTFDLRMSIVPNAGGTAHLTSVSASIIIIKLADCDHHHES